MASINHAGLSFRGGASLPTDLGQALSEQLRQFFARVRTSAPSDAPSFGGPSLDDLSPDLARESAHR